MLYVEGSVLCCMERAVCCVVCRGQCAVLYGEGSVLCCM